MLVVSQSPLSALNCRLDELWADDEDLTPTGDGQPVVEDGPSGRGVHEERGWKSWYRRTAVLHDDDDDSQKRCRALARSSGGVTC